MATDKTARAGAGIRTARQPAGNVEEQSELKILGSVREFMLQNHLLWDVKNRKVRAGKDSGNPTFIVQATKKTPDIEGLEFQKDIAGIVLSKSAGELFDIGDSLDIDTLSIGFGASVEDPTIDRLIICTGIAFGSEEA